MVRIGFFNEYNVNKWDVKKCNKLRFFKHLLEFSGDFLLEKEKVEHIHTKNSILVIEVTKLCGAVTLMKTWVMTMVILARKAWIMKNFFKLFEKSQFYAIFKIWINDIIITERTYSSQNYEMLGYTLPLTPQIQGFWSFLSLIRTL